MFQNSTLRLYGYCHRTSHFRLGTRFLSTKSCDPLRILFCGSDEFSAESLKAIHQLHVAEPQLVQSIDVVCRPPKRTGRGLKITREVRVSEITRGLSLPLHHVDSFKGWQLPEYRNVEQAKNTKINLIVAVSFGLLIPQRILSAAKYGGLNVHPSMLPDFRGAAPIEHTLLAERSHTGVTLQTLHPTKMDHGQIVLQTPKPGIPIRDLENPSPAALLQKLAVVGAEMLTHGLQERLFVPPVQDLAPTLTEAEKQQLRLAPKIKPEDRHIQWQHWTADEILLRSRVLGHLWSYCITQDGDIRITFSHGLRVTTERSHAMEVRAGVPVADSGSSERTALHFKTIDNKVLVANHITVPGYGTKPAADIAQKLKAISPIDALVSQADQSLR